MELYERDLWTNPGISSVFGGEIIEYDIESAGLNLIIKYHLLPEAEIETLEKLPKDKRNVRIGKMQRKDPAFARDLSGAFIDARKLFFEANEIASVDVISIKKDAIFLNREVLECTFGNVHFRPKNVFSSYLRLDKVEVYYNQDGIQYKNLGRDDERFFEDSITKMLEGIFYRMETKTKEDAIRYLRRYMDRYKHRELDIAFYRNFMAGGAYTIISSIGDKNLYPVVSDDRINEIEIYDNWVSVFCKLALILI